LHACAACRSRFAAFTSWLEDVRVDGQAEAEAAFPAERLAAQHAQIFRRLEAAERPARVIRFPKFARPITSRTSHVHRWVATSAAAGLIVGVGIGQMMDFRHITTRAPESTSARRAEPVPLEVPIRAANTTSSDAEFLADVEDSAMRSTVAELRAIDGVTPRAPFVDERR
jgi:hypothetical protein